MGHRFPERQIKCPQFTPIDIFYQSSPKRRSIDNTQFLFSSVSSASIDISVLLLFTPRKISDQTKFPQNNEEAKEDAETGSVTLLVQRHSDVSVCEVRLRKNIRWKSQSGGHNYIRINSIMSAYGVPRVNQRATALSNFRHFSYLSMAPAKCRSSFGRRCLRVDLRNILDIVFERRWLLRRAIGGGDSISTPSVILLLFPDANRENFFPIDSFISRRELFMQTIC